MAAADDCRLVLVFWFGHFAVSGYKWIEGVLSSRPTTTVTDTLALLNSPHTELSCSRASLTVARVGIKSTHLYALVSTDRANHEPGAIWQFRR